MKKQVMVRAWEIYRSLVGDKIAKLSYAMKKAWAEVKAQANAVEEKVYGGEYGTITESKLDELFEMGAGIWEKAGKKRLYLNEAVEKIVGLEIERYKSGNICYAEICGEKISNSEAGRALYELRNVYVDMITGKICISGKGQYIDMLLENIKKYVA